jgi:pimeloyl-ACP methyl ester carboxylesterase
MNEIVLLPGAWHGAWAYDRVLACLALAGQPAHALGLRGIGDGTGPEGTNLETHIRQVVDHLHGNEIREVILCAHSYAGMVLTEVLARCSQRIAAAVYLDAFVASPGQSLFDLATDRFRDHCLSTVGRDGLTVPPISAAPDERCSPHPLACFLQASTAPSTVFETFRRRGGHLRYLHFTGWEPSPFGRFAARLRDDPNWVVVAREYPHDAVRDRPAELADLLLRAAMAGPSPQP